MESLDPPETRNLPAEIDQAAKDHPEIESLLDAILCLIEPEEPEEPQEPH